MREELITHALNKTSVDTLASICPRCFGPGERSKRDAEPDSIVCLDANFQQRRHAAASHELDELPATMPSSFLTEEQVQEWAQRASRRGHSEENLVSICPFSFGVTFWGD